jgi:tetratricopeptide (TPR) repeat protein
VLEGSVRKASNRIRVTAQLVKASDGFQAWSGRYDREMNGVFAVQDEIAQAIVEKLKGKLSAAPLASSRERHSQNLEAYNAYLRGRYYLWRIDVASVNRARECFERAIALDPNYALAYTGIATGLFMLSTIDVADTIESLTEAKRLLEKAVGLDATLAEARVLLGAVRVCLDYDWEGAEREFRQALAAEAVSADCLDTYGRWVLWPQRRFEEALSVYERAHKLEPLIPTFVYHSAEVFLCTGEYEKSIQQCRKALEIESHFWIAHTLTGWNFVFLERRRTKRYGHLRQRINWNRKTRSSRMAWSQRMPWAAGGKRLGRSRSKAVTPTRTARRCVSYTSARPIECSNCCTKPQINETQICFGLPTSPNLVN